MVWTDDEWRVIRVSDNDFPAFYRVVSGDHVSEFSRLSSTRRKRCMELVSAVEGALIETLEPTSINLAAFGNVVPHLHWHVIARFDWDSHFPEPVWAPARRTLDRSASELVGYPLAGLDQVVASAVSRV